MRRHILAVRPQLLQRQCLRQVLVTWHDQKLIDFFYSNKLGEKEDDINDRETSPEKK